MRHVLWSGATLTLLLALVTADNVRLNCLQYEQGKELSYTPWSRGYVSADKKHQKGEAWIYNNTKCPLTHFSEATFCQKAMRCGTHILLVGDSTVYRIASTLVHLMDHEVKLSQCPTENFCGWKDFPPCPPHEYNEKVREYRVCDKFCPPNKPVRVTYIRHDYLNHIHGHDNIWSVICEHWKTVAPSVDYLLLSIGPHISRMLSYPYGKPPPSDFDEEAFFQSEAQSTTELVRTLLAPNATLIYRTGAVGVLHHYPNCDVDPHDAPPHIYPNYHWDKIPALNAAYIRALTEGIEDRPVLVMDTATLFMKMRGCRNDPLHFEYKSPVAPVLLEWMLLQNLLVELHSHQQKAALAAKQSAAVRYKGDS